MGQETTRLDDDMDDLRTSTAQPELATDDPDQIEREIEHTRAELSETIDEIQERLNPEALKEQAKSMAHDATIGKVVDAKDQAVGKVQEFAGQAMDKVRGVTGGENDGYRSQSGFTTTARDSGGAVLDTIRANPVPAALAGAGLGWFLMRRSNDSNDYQYRSSYMSNTPRYRAGYRSQGMDYRTGYTSWDRRQPEPGHLRAYEEEGMLSHVSDAGSSVVGMIQRNPLPAALAGVGLGWLLMRRSNGGQHGDQPYYYEPSHHTTFTGGYQGNYPGQYQGQYQGGYGYQSSQGYPAYQGTTPQTGYQANWQQTGEQGEGRVSEMTGAVQETAGDAMHRAQEMGSQAKEQVAQYGSQAFDQVSQFGATARDQMSHLPHQAQGQFQNLRGTYEQKLHESPLLMGAVALGLGMAVGMLIPETQRENQLLGERRDEMMERAQEMAGEAVDKVQTVAQDAAHAAQETVQEATRETGQSSSSASMSGTQQRAQTSTTSTSSPTS